MTGTSWSNLMISSCFVNQWKVGLPFRIFWQRHQWIPLWNPSPLNWSTYSISWTTLAAGSLTIGSQLAQLIRLRRRKSKLQPSWTTCHLRWTIQYHNAVESTNWKMFTSNLESHQMNLLIISELLLIDVNFPTEEKKEWNVHYRFARAFSDKELIKKLLALDLTATTTKMLEVCCTHITISGNLEAMGLKEQKTVNAIQRQNKPHQGKKPPAHSVHSCGHCMKSHPPGKSSCLATNDNCQGCGKLGH